LRLSSPALLALRVNGRQTEAKMGKSAGASSPGDAGPRGHQGRSIQLARRLRLERHRGLAGVKAYAEAAGLIALAVVVGALLGHTF
jgi:hypothetical protein